MLGQRRVIAVVPARAGSKAVPGKNIRPLGGKPLIAWSIEAGKAVKQIDRVIVSPDEGGYLSPLGEQAEVGQPTDLVALLRRRGR